MCNDIIHKYTLFYINTKLYSKQYSFIIGDAVMNLYMSSIVIYKEQCQKVLLVWLIASVLTPPRERVARESPNRISPERPPTSLCVLRHAP